MSEKSLLPGSWLGLVGGGQLGRMFAMAAQSLGYPVAVLDPDPDSPASAVSSLHICADYQDAEALERLAGLCSAVTTEFENVPAQTLEFLSEHATVRPAAQSVAIAQDRIREKQFIQNCGISVARHGILRNEADVLALTEDIFPAIVKASRFGYDGKGQFVVTDQDAARAAFLQLDGMPCVVEKRLDLDFEISVIVARDRHGQVVVYPIAQNLHRTGILAVSISPAPRLDAELGSRAELAACQIATQLDYVGVLCVEFFVLNDGSLVVNEMAPRPHNSGHFTIDACYTSQFEQQARILAGLPLGSTHQHSPSVMLNLLGDLWFDGVTQQRREPDWAGVLSREGVTLHLYGKREARPGRKMGHVTVLGDSPIDAHERAAAVAYGLGIAPW